MESFDTKKLVELVRQEFPELELTVARDFLGEDLYHFQVSGELASGFGTHLDQRTAFLKSFSEYIERLTMKHHGFRSSNGIAAHPLNSSARKGSINELIERDVFLSSWLAGRGPKWLADSEISVYVSERGQNQIERLRGQNLHLQLGISGVLNGILVVVSALTGLRFKFPFGVSVTTAAGENLMEALDSVIMNQRRVPTQVINSHKQGVMPIACNAVSSPADHQLYYLVPDRVESMDWFLRSSREVSVFPDLEIISEPLKIPVKTPWSMSVYRSHSAFAQQYFVGKTGKRVWNESRILTLIDDLGFVNHQLHPLP